MTVLILAPTADTPVDVVVRELATREVPAAQTPTSPRPQRLTSSEPEHRTTNLDPRTPWTSLVVWFLASFELGADISLGYCRFHGGQPTAASIMVGDGSWAEITLADDQGVHGVAESGPRRVWRIIENAHARWCTLGRPGWNRFGVTVTEDHQQVWLDSPTSGHTWQLQHHSTHTDD